MEKMEKMEKLVKWIIRVIYHIKKWIIGTIYNIKHGKEWIIGINLKVTKWIFRIKNIIKKWIKEVEEPVTVLSLAPKTFQKEGTLKNYEVYKEHLDAAFRDDTIRNIAVTGDFGVGKSSFLKWYAKKKKYLFISLCDFSGSGDKKTLDELGCDVCQQLRIACATETKAHTAYRIVNRILGFLYIIIAFAVAFFYLALNNVLGIADRIDGICQKADWQVTIPTFLKNIQWLFDLIAGAEILGAVIFAAVFIVRRFPTAKITVKNNYMEAELAFEKEAELASEKKEEIKYLDMVRVYLVRELANAAKKFDYTVIFEDFDRINNAECRSLFTDIRELNRLVNMQLDKQRRRHKRPMRFIYVAKDDVFGNEAGAGNGQQLKFFDYIMPFMPEIYKESSAEYLQKCLESVGVGKEDIIKFNEFHTASSVFQHWGTDEVIEDRAVNKYLYDYRTIRNIANEYQIISRTAIFCAWDSPYMHQKILALATLKTLLPEEYYKLRTAEINEETLKEIGKKSPCIEELIKRGWLDTSVAIYIGDDVWKIYAYFRTLILSEKYHKQVIEYILHYYSYWRMEILGDKDVLKKIVDCCALILLKAEYSCEIDREGEKNYQYVGKYNVAFMREFLEKTNDIDFEEKRDTSFDEYLSKTYEGNWYEGNWLGHIISEVLYNNDNNVALLFEYLYKYIDHNTWIGAIDGILKLPEFFTLCYAIPKEMYEEKVFTDYVSKYLNTDYVSKYLNDLNAFGSAGLEDFRQMMTKCEQPHPLYAYLDKLDIHDDVRSAILATKADADSAASES